MSSSSAAATWGLLGFVGLTLQVIGLLLETLADSQKNGFKSRHRHSWCNVGVWKLSTHPNYLGEGLFWWGTYLGNGFHSLPLTLLATTGLGFIMMVLKGAARSLSSKQKEKYGQDADFYEFQRTHNVFGPKHWWWWLHGMEELSRPVVPNGVATPSNVANYDTSGQFLDDGIIQTMTNGSNEEIASP
jgi:steroid 5-alpha reductase family enzyme